MPIQKHLDLSTAHMTSKDDALLHDIYGRVDSQNPSKKGALFASPVNGGWLVSTSPYYLDDADKREFEKAAREEGFSDPFINVLRYAAGQACWHVRFDQDADYEPGLRAFNWEKNDEEIEIEQPDEEPEAAPAFGR